MRTDQDRVRTAVRALADAVPVVPPPAAAVRARATEQARAAERPRPTARPVVGRAARPRRQTRRWLAPALAATAILGLVAVVAAVPGLLRSSSLGESEDSGNPPVLPERFAGRSERTAGYLESPPGPAIAIYNQGSTQPADRDNSQQLIVGADGRTYRQLGWGNPEQVGVEFRWDALRGSLLSPDGSLLAIPGYFDDHNIAVIDLATGEETMYPVAGSSILAWSPDSRRIAVGRGPSSDLNERPLSDAGVTVLDLVARPFHTFELGSQEPRAAAFSPDGGLLAVHAEVADPGAYWAAGTWEPEGGSVRIFDLEGTPEQTISLPVRQGLAPGGAAWSPDGSLLTVIEATGDPATYGLAFLDATGSGNEVPSPIVTDKEEVVLLGWRSPATMLVGWDDGSSRGTNLIAEVPVDGSPSATVSQLSLGDHDWVTGLRLASGLVAHAQIRDAGSPSRGPWWRSWLTQSLPVVIVLGAALLFAGLILVGLRHRMSGGSRPPFRQG
jgi:hypothetical protein